MPHHRPRCPAYAVPLPSLGVTLATQPGEGSSRFRSTPCAFGPTRGVSRQGRDWSRGLDSRPASRARPVVLWSWTTSRLMRSAAAETSPHLHGAHGLVTQATAGRFTVSHCGLAHPHGIEPWTYRLTAGRSTTELRALTLQFRRGWRTPAVRSAMRSTTLRLVPGGELESPTLSL